MSRTLLLVALLTLTATPAFADETEDLIAAGTEAYQNEDYDAALQAFLLAQEKSPSPDLLYNIARVYESKGDYAKAAEYYKKFIAVPNADVDAREDAVKRLKIARELIEPEKKPDPKEPPKKDPPVDPPPEVPTASGPSPLTWVFLGTGVLAAGAGAYFGLTASGQGEELRAVCTGGDALLCPASAEETLGSMRQNALFADISFGAAGLFAIAGIVTLVVTSGADEAETTSSIAPIVTPDGAGVTWSLRF